MRGERRAVARALTKVENDEAGARELLAAVQTNLGRAFVIGVTGPPGTGKSTLIDRIIVHYRKSGKKVGVLAVDPTSPVTGGALLGDRIRMAEHTMDSGVFIRSMASRGWSGGLSGAVTEAIQILDAAGTDVILVETVGIGQSDVEIMKIAHLVIVVTMPGLGDGIQVSKAGLMEIGDVYVVNKSELPGADAMVVNLLEMARGIKGRSPSVLKLSALTNEGVATLFKVLEERRAKFGSPEGDEIRLRSIKGMIIELAKRRALMQFDRKETEGKAASLAQQVADHGLSYQDAVRRLIGGQRR